MHTDAIRSIVRLETLLRLVWRLAEQKTILGRKLINLNHATAHENVRNRSTPRTQGRAVIYVCWVFVELSG